VPAEKRTLILAKRRSWKSTLNVSDTRKQKLIRRTSYTWTWLEDGSLQGQPHQFYLAVVIDSGQGTESICIISGICAFYGLERRRENPSKERLHLAQITVIMPVAALELMVSLSEELYLLICLGQEWLMSR